MEELQIVSLNKSRRARVPQVIHSRKCKVVEIISEELIPDKKNTAKYLWVIERRGAEPVGQNSCAFFLSAFDWELNQVYHLELDKKALEIDGKEQQEWILVQNQPVLRNQKGLFLFDFEKRVIKKVGFDQKEQIRVVTKTRNEELILYQSATTNDPRSSIYLKQRLPFSGFFKLKCE